MEFEDREEHKGEEGGGDIETGPSYDSLGNSKPSTQPKMSSSMSPGGDLAALMDAPLQMRKPRYRECLKNHAVGIGGHAVDGCGEFMAAGEDGSLNALKCAACNCHRNFHRKETDAATALVHFGYHPHPHRPPAGYLHHFVPPPPQRPLALPSTSGGGGSYRDEILEDMEMSNPNDGGGGSSKKRFRTKFSQEQKDKMFELAEKLGWRIQKQDEEAVQQLCNDYGVRRHVFKVWMHNNKHTLADSKNG